MKLAFVLLFISSLCVVSFGASRRVSSNQGLFINDWAQRVVNNGGALPSQATIQCMETLRLALIAQGITNKIYSMCVFVPDSVIASATPLFIHQGYPMWTNNFVTGDLTINGLKGDGTTKAMDSGVKAKAGSGIGPDGNYGLSVIVTESSSLSQNAVMGYRDEDGLPLNAMYVSDAGTTYFFPADNANANEYIITNDFARVGYVSGNVDSNATAAMYFASPLEAHKLIQTKSSVTEEQTLTENTFSVFAVKRGTTNEVNTFSFQRLSAALFHNWFTETESSNVWVALRTCRECLGGGTGDNIHDYNRKIVAAGGANISTTTSNALRTFYTGMDTDGTLYRMISANPIVPDNLTAARIPLVWQWGSEVWTNFNFGTTNLSVNGLQGNGTDKYLATGITNFFVANRDFSGISAGLAVMMFANPDTGGNAIIGAQGTNVSQWSVFSFGGSGLYRCWRTANVNLNFVQGTVGTTTNGWLSAQRTAATAIAMYKARADTAHTLVTNSAGTQTGAPFPSHASFVFALNNAGAPSAFHAATISFAALSSGLTQTQSSNLYVRVNTLRTALGGGSP